MSNIKEASGLTKVALLLSSIGLLLHIIGFATTSWYDDYSSHHVGLWSECYGNICNNHFYKSGSFKSVEAFETIGLILTILSVGAFVYWCVAEDVPPRSALNMWIVIGLGSAALSIFIGDMIFGINVIPPRFQGSASFILSIFGGVVIAIAAILEAVQLNSNTRTQDNERQPLRNNDASQPQQQHPNSRQDRSGSHQPTNSNAFSARSGYQNETQLYPEMSYNTEERRGPGDWIATAPQQQPYNGSFKRSSTNGKLSDSYSVSQDENDLLSTLPGALDPAVSKTDDSTSVEITKAGHVDNYSVLNKIL